MDIGLPARTLLIAALAYLAGSINFSIILLRLFSKGDPRNWSSGNPGVTNVYRQHGILWAVPILALDMGRSAVAALVGSLVLPVTVLPWILLALLFGNKFPIFHRFRGGKGVANFLGFTAALTPALGLVSGVAWLAYFKLSKEAFIGSFAMVIVLAIALATHCEWTALPLAGVLANVALIVLNHRKNIAGKWGPPSRR